MWRQRSAKLISGLRRTILFFLSTLEAGIFCLEPCDILREDQL